MQKVKNFDGKLVVKVRQTNKKDIAVEKEIVINGFKVLDTDRIAESIAEAIIKVNQISRVARRKPLFSSVYPLHLHISDGSKHMIFDTNNASIEQSVRLAIKPTTVKKLSDAIFGAIASVTYKPTICKSTDMSVEKAELNKTLWNKVAEIAESADTELVS